MRSILLTFTACLGVMFLVGCGEGPKKIVEQPDQKAKTDTQHAAKSAALKDGKDPAKAGN
jgi:hypothetical protein